MSDGIEAFSKPQLWQAALNAQRLINGLCDVLHKDDWSAEKKIEIIRVLVAPFMKGTNGKQEPSATPEGPAASTEQSG